MKISARHITIAVILIIVSLVIYTQFTPNKTSSFQEDIPSELVIYSGRKEPLILPIINEFEKQTGTKVTVKSGSSQELANLLLDEKEKTLADVYIGTDAGWLNKLADAGLFIPIETEGLEDVPDEYKSADALWTGVSGRSRVLIVNTDLVDEGDYPASIYDIVEPTWKGRVAMAKLSNESVVTHLSAMRELHSDKFVETFLNGLKDNEVRLLPGHTDVRKAVSNGEYAVGFVNHYYGHLQQQESSNIEIIYPDQADGEDGTFVNVSGVGIVKHTKNTKRAQEFIEYLLTAQTQELFAQLNFEYPLVAGVSPTNTKGLDEFKKMDVRLHEVAEKMNSTISLIKKLGL